MANLINGKTYPLWQQFVDRKEEWIGGTMTDFGEPADVMSTMITDVALTPNGSDSAWFEFSGRDFNCAFDTGHGGILPDTVENGLMMYRHFGGKFSVQRKAHLGEPVTERPA